MRFDEQITYSIEAHHTRITNNSRGVIKGTTSSGFRHLSTTNEEPPPVHRLNAFSYSTFEYTICLINTRANRSLISTKTRNQGNKHTRNTKGKGRKQRKTVQGLSGNRKPIGLMSRNHLCVSNFHGLLKS